MSAELKAGFFVLAALAALVMMTTRLTQNRYSYKGTKNYHAILKDATGLFNKTKLKMAGLDVGELSNVELEGGKAKLTMAVAADIAMHKDARVAVKSIGFLGDKYIELFPGTSSAPILEEGGMIAEGNVSGGLEELTQKTTEVLDNIKDITQVLKDALQGKDEDEDSRLDRILDNMENFTAGLSSIEKYGELADRLNEVAINVRDITDKIKKGEGTVGKLLTDSETIDKINSTLSGVNKFISKADKTALVLDGHGGLLTQTGGSKMYVSLAFQPTWDKYYLLGVNTGPRFSSNVTRTTTTNNPDQPGASSSTVRTDNQNENAIFINAQFAKRFEDTVVRLGLFETTGGFAVDQYFMDDELKLYSEVYRFSTSAGSNAKAQINLGAEIHLYKPFYVWLGGDDLLNNTYRNAFVGAGLRFTDNDLKLFATSASGAITK